MKAILKYSDETVAFGSMSYNFSKFDVEKAKELLQLPMVNLKFIPGAAEGVVDIAQLTKMEYSDINIKSAFKSPCKIQFNHHVNAPLKDIPVEKAL